MTREINESSDVKISSTNNKRLSKIMAIEFDDNDDIKEKKAQNKRKSVLLELGLNTSSKNRATDNSKLTSDQITNHYGDCMKLSSENKITSKNAFDLHLIDYLQDHLKRLQSFQVLSSSLEAGAKIYAGRVDMVHSNTYSIFTRCDISPEDDKQEEVVPDENDEDLNPNNEIKTRRPKKRTDVNKKVTCTNIKKIRLTSAQIRSEVDPLFQSQSQKYDEGGSGELRVNNLKLLDSDYQLLLDFESIVSTKSVDCNDASDPDVLFDISNFAIMFQELSSNQIPISCEFDNFKFTGYDSNNDNTTSQVAESLKQMLFKEESIMENNDDHYNNYDDDDCGGYDDIHGVKEDMNEDKQVDTIEDTRIGEEDNNNVEEVEDNMLKIGTSKYDNESRLFVSSVKEMVNSFMDNYGEINDNVLGMWAGPDHWKLKAKPIKIVNPNFDNPKIEKPKKAKKELTPMFADYVETRYNSDGIGRLLNIKKCDENEQADTKVSKQLTDECINKNMKKEYLLPLKCKFILKSINQLMNRDISLVNKALKQQSDQLTNVHLDKDQLPSLETDMDNDVFEVIHDDMLVIDADGNISHYDDYGGGGDDYYSDDDPYTGKSLRNCDFDDFGGQMPLRTVESQDINYAKTAKKINVKKLKQDIQSYLNEQIHIIDFDTIAKLQPNLQKPKDFCNLSDLLTYVDKKSAPEVSKELSVSILMTCLLHLANETGLDITNVDGFSDFSLGQGFSEYDIEQVTLFGKEYLGRPALARNGGDRYREEDDASDCE